MCSFRENFDRLFRTVVSTLAIAEVFYNDNRARKFNILDHTIEFTFP